MPTPSYVKLRDPNGLLVDVDGSGWSISGVDVLPFPSDDERAAQAFVRSRLNLNVLVEASEKDYNAVQKTTKRLAEVAATPEGQLSAWQENRVQAEARKVRQALREDNAEALLAQETPQGAIGEQGQRHVLPDENEDVKRREAIIEESRKSGELDDDPEAQKVRSTEGNPAKNKRGKSDD